MASIEYFVVLPFDRDEDGNLVPGKAQECQTPISAQRRAQSMATVRAGAIAFSRSGDPKTGDFEPAKVIKRFGEVPTVDALMGYE